MENVSIHEIERDELDQFFTYLRNHLNENGEESLLFQPITREQLKINSEWTEKFTTGFSTTFGKIGWRKLWVAKTNRNQIIGHIDIRSRNELNTTHRVLLGMGVDSGFRGLRIGHSLLKYAIEYCKDHERIHWIDLEVLTDNTPAIKLYIKNDFEVLTNYVDMFRIGGKSYDYTLMTLEVSRKIDI